MQLSIMFSDTKYIENSFNIFFPRQSEIRKQAFALEELLKADYSEPQIIPVPDNFDPEVPRIIFSSKHGFSHILISQVNIIMNVRYSSDYQIDASKGKQYLKERVPRLFQLLAKIDGMKPHFCGLSTRVDIPCNQTDAAVIKHLSSLLLKNGDTKNRHDVQVKFTDVVENKYFSNITIQNYRTWEIDQSASLPALSSSAVTERGVRLGGDFNDRRAYNEDSSYNPNVRDVPKIIEKAFSILEHFISKVRQKS